VKGNEYSEEMYLILLVLMLLLSLYPLMACLDITHMTHFRKPVLKVQCNFLVRQKASKCFAVRNGVCLCDR